MNEQEARALASLGVSLAVLKEIGFEHAQESCLPNRLPRIPCDGGTALRDSIAQGILLMLRLNTLVHKLGLGGLWNFVHIVITDGQDTSSQTSLEDLGAMMLLLGKTIPAEFLKTVFIGVDLDQDPKAMKELLALRLLGLDNAEIYTTNNAKVDDIFERIKVDLGIQVKREVMVAQRGNQVLAMERQQVNQVIQLKKQRFVVLLNLDRSGSMSGTRWNRATNASLKFLDHLTNEDLVDIVSKLKVEPPRQIMAAPQPQPQIQYVYVQQLPANNNQANKKQLQKNQQANDQCCCTIF